MIWQKYSFFYITQKCVTQKCVIVSLPIFYTDVLFRSAFMTILPEGGGVVFILAGMLYYNTSDWIRVDDVYLMLADNGGKCSLIRK